VLAIVPPSRAGRQSPTPLGFRFIEIAPDPSGAWNFNFANGQQQLGNKDGSDFDGFAWAVRDGDVGPAVPVPPAVWLFGSALGLLGWLRRKKV
jgi:hypothetical protein